jgi:hypothetical protein
MSSDEFPGRRPAIAAQPGRKRRKLGGSLQRVCASPRIRALRCGTHLRGLLPPPVATRCQRVLAITARNEAAEGLEGGARYFPPEDRSESQRWNISHSVVSSCHTSS